MVIRLLKAFVPKPKDVEADLISAGLNTLKIRNVPISPAAGESEGLPSL
jgi:hypothetical protein